MRLKPFIIILAISLYTSCSVAHCSLRDDFLNNEAIICGINIRNFNSKDLNNNGLIEQGEENGTFINAIERLDELKKFNINAIHVLPITPVGKLKALGTAGSLYAISDFSTINSQLIDTKSQLTPIEQAKLFVQECHKRGIRVIIDLPSCGSYDLFLKRPELFIKDDNQFSVIPTDWTDVRLFNAGNNEKLNLDLLSEHYKFIDMITEINADGVRADVATIKPSRFWKEVINYAREKNPNILFLAEASDSWREPPSPYAQFTPYDKLLEVGFDGYYGSFFNLKDWKTSEDLFEHIKFNKKFINSYPEKKSVILSFTTHDEISPIILHGEEFSVMISWLEATLPFNPYIIDGFEYGADYIYPWANSKAVRTSTDDDYYFVHRGKLDIFNFSAKPFGNSEFVRENYKNAMSFRVNNNDLVINGTFVPLKASKTNVFAYERTCNGQTMYVLGNLDYDREYKKVSIKVPGLKKNASIKLIAGTKGFKIYRNKLVTDMKQGEIKVLLVRDFTL
ncbi:MAG: hypothetical protein MJ237_05155 [bacterium]|nr:hypothetical protein [bacterium]